MASDSGEKGSLDCITPNTSLPVLPVLPVLSSSSSYTRTDIQLFTLLNRLPLPIRLRAGRKGLCALLNLICPSVCVCVYGCTRRVRTAHVHLSHFTSPNSHADRNSNPGPFRFPLQRANRRRPCSLHPIIIITCFFFLSFRLKLPGRFYELNIHYGLFVGGLGDFREIFLGLWDNFRGCLNDLQYNGVDVLTKVKDRDKTIASGASSTSTAVVQVNNNLPYYFIAPKRIRISMRFADWGGRLERVDVVVVVRCACLCVCTFQA